MKSHSELIWDFIKAHPGARSADVHAALAGDGPDKVPAYAINSNLARMCKHRGLLNVISRRGRPKQYEVIGDEYPARATSKPPAKAKPAAAPAATVAPAAAPATEPAAAVDPAAPHVTDREKVWTTVHEFPGKIASELVALAMKLGVKKTSAYTVISQLTKKGRLACDPEARTYTAVGDAWKPGEPPKPVLGPAAPAWTEENKHLWQGRDPNAMPTSSLGSAEPVAPSESAALAPTEGDSRKKRHIVWKQEEIDACIAAWAQDHISAARSMSDKGLRQVALIDGRGYRVKKFTADAARKFVERYKGALQAEIDRQLAAPPAPPPAPEPEAPAPAPAMVTPPEPSLGELIEKALTEAIGRAVTLAMAASEARIAATIADALAARPGHRPRPAPVEPHADQPAKVKGPQVIVINALPEQFQSVQRAFPDLDLRLVRDRMPGEDNPDLVIGMVKFMSHPLEYALKRKYKDKYHRVNGAADSVKIAIEHKLHVPPVARVAPSFH